MKKYIVVLSVLFSLSALFAINVDEKEVQTGADDTVDFVNYTGTHDEVDTVEAIRGIGRSLAGAASSGREGTSDRYMIIHAVDSTMSAGLDADILILGERVRVDHIDNLRLIIEGYLSSAYNYSRKDAKTLAHFITIYNAVYRGRMDMFNKKYKSFVVQNISSNKVGLSTTYSEWPGNTQIVIPLSDARYAGTVSTVDTTVISDKEVVNKMKEQDDKDIDARKDMVDLKEQEAEEARSRAEEEREKALQKEKEAEEARKRAEEAKKKEDEKGKELEDKEANAESARKVADDAKKKGDKDQAEKERLAKEAEEAAEKTRKEKEALEAERLKSEQEAKQKEDEAKTAKENAKQEDEFAQGKEDDAQDDRKDIAKDTQKIIEDKRAEKKAETDALIASANRGYALKVVDEYSLSSSIVMLDLRNARTIKTSSLNTIKGRKICKAGEYIMAIAGSSGGDGVVSLVLIDMRNLEVAKQGDDEISEKSMLVQDGEFYYAIVATGGKFYVGRFNEELMRQSLSTVSISPYSPIIVSEEGLLVQDENKNIHLLDKKELKDVVNQERSFTSFRVEEKR